MASQYGNGIGRIVVGYGSYGYEPKLKQVGPLAFPVGILPGSIATNMRVHHSSWRKDNSKGDNNIAFTIGMNTSVLEGAISEQLFCNKKVNPNNEPCYGISTVSGLQRAAQQGQKIYQINQKNRAQLKNIAMSGKEMANDINRAINSGGYVIVPEKVVDGTGRNAIYVYMTYNAQDGYQTWKISGGLNGGWFQGYSSIVTYVAYTADFFDIVTDYQVYKKGLSDLYSRAFGIVGVVLDIWGAMLNIGALFEACGVSADSILGTLLVVGLTAITLTVAIAASAFTGGIAALIFGIISSFISSIYNNLISRVVGTITSDCRRKK